MHDLPTVPPTTPDPDAEQCAGDAVVPTVTVTRNGEEIAGVTPTRAEMAWTPARARMALEE